MQKWPFGLIAWIVGCLVALLFAFVPADSRWAAFDRIFLVLAAIGTTASAVVALWLGLRQSNEGKQRDYDAAVVLAAGMSDLIDPALQHLSLAIAGIVFEKIPPLETDALITYDLEQQKQILQLAFSAPAFEHGFETISKLAPLPNRCAVRLYKARSMMKALQHEIEMCLDGGAWLRMDNNQKRSKLRGWASAASEAVTYFQHVNGDLKRLAEQVGADLTVEERYGPWTDDE